MDRDIRKVLAGLQHLDWKQKQLKALQAEVGALEKLRDTVASFMKAPKKATKRAIKKVKKFLRHHPVPKGSPAVAGKRYTHATSELNNNGVPRQNARPRRYNLHKKCAGPGCKNDVFARRSDARFCSSLCASRFRYFGAKAEQKAAEKAKVKGTRVIPGDPLRAGGPDA